MFLGVGCSRVVEVLAVAAVGTCCRDHNTCPPLPSPSIKGGEKSCWSQTRPKGEIHD